MTEPLDSEDPGDWGEGIDEAELEKYRLEWREPSADCGHGADERCVSCSILFKECEASELPRILGGLRQLVQRGKWRASVHCCPLGERYYLRPAHVNDDERLITIDVYVEKSK